MNSKFLIYTLKRLGMALLTIFSGDCDHLFRDARNTRQPFQQ